MTITITGASGSGSVEILPTRITVTKRHTVKIVPLGPTAVPLCLDLGIGEYDIEIEGYISSAKYQNPENAVTLLLQTIKNPVTITVSEGSRYPEIVTGDNVKWRIIEKSVDRRGGYVRLWEVRLRVQRTTPADTLITGGV